MSLRMRVAVLGGADPNDPLESNNILRHVAAGILVLTVATWALVATTLAFHSNLHASWPTALTGGMLISTIILSIDLLITSTPLTRDTAGARARVIMTRGMVSLAMGLVISHATILVMDRSTLQQMVATKNQAAVAADTKKIKDASPYPAEIAATQQQATADIKQIAAADTALTNAQKELDRRKKAWLDDRLCVNGTKAANGDACGRGDVANSLQTAYESYLNYDMPAARKLHDDTVNAISADLTAQKNANATAIAKLNDEIKNGVAADIANTGLVAQSDALWTLLKHDTFAWLWPIFFFIIDLAVALMKGLLPESDFDRRRRTARQQDEALDLAGKDAPVWAELAMYKAEREAQVIRARIDADTERRINALGARARDNVGPWRHWPATVRRRNWVVGTAALLIALALLTSGLWRSPARQGAQPQAAGKTSTTSSAAPTVRPTQQPFAYPLKPPVISTARATREYLLGAGSELLTLHRAATALDQTFVASTCRTGLSLIHSDDHKLTNQIAGLPDPLLAELILDEVHELAMQTPCSSKQDSHILHDVVGVTSQRLTQIGV
ncbi:MAG: DUF4407 domain-containing protein [Jatrophihabitantaceae bacterium]